MEYLVKKLKPIWHVVAKAQVGLLKAAIEDGIMDAGVFEKAKIPKVASRLAIIKPPKEKQEKKKEKKKK